MSAENRDSKGWSRRLDGLIKRVDDEVGGERGEKVRERLTQAKSRVEAGLESEEARRVREEMATLGDKAMERVDDALRHERTQAVVKRVDATLTEIGDRIRGEPAEPRSAPPGRGSDYAAAQSDEAAARADESASAADEAASRVDEMSAGADERAARADETASAADEQAARVDEAKAEADEVAARADERVAEADEAEETRGAAPDAGNVAPAISQNGEDESAAANRA